MALLHLWIGLCRIRERLPALLGSWYSLHGRKSSRSSWTRKVGLMKAPKDLNTIADVVLRYKPPETYEGMSDSPLPLCKRPEESAGNGTL